MATKTEWETDEDLSTWERIKAAMANDWEQTKNDLGFEDVRNLNQDVDDTLKQAVNADDQFENHQQALRFGLACKRRFQAQEWDEGLASELRDEYKGNFDADYRQIRYAYEYEHLK